MINEISSSDLSNEISMMRSGFAGTVILVEGNTDRRIYSKFLAPDARMLVAHSKDNVIKCVKESRTRRGDNRVVGFLDADLDRLEGHKRDPPLFMTDYRDMESMIMHSGALEAVLSEYADPDKLETF